MFDATSGSEASCVSQRTHEGIAEMNDLFLLEPEYHYHTERARRQLKAVRYRKWRRRLDFDGPQAVTDEKNWIS